MGWLLGGYLAMVLGFVLVGHLKSIFSCLKLPRLGEVQPDLKEWPKLSFIVAACNEEEHIEAAVKTMLAVDYPSIEMILVNDRSTDGTGALVDRLAAADPRIHAVHITTLPEGWLGKVHALHCATEKATGDFLLYVDADVHLEPGALQRAVTLCEREKAGHLSVLPCLRSTTFAGDSAISVFGVGFLSTLNVHKIGKPGSDAYAGVGAFSLVRRSDFLKTEGWSWLRMEIADDVGLGLMMVRQAKAKSLLLTGGDQIRVIWHKDLPSLIRGLEKNAFAGITRFQIGRTLALVCGITSVPIATVGALLSPWLWLQGLAGLYLLSFLPLAWAFQTRIRQPWLATMVCILFYPVLAWILLRSMIKNLKDGGIYWRGTFYPLAQLKAGQRLDH